ncbi:polysaccharide biosynthesis/export family protein [Methylobacterium nodulans]|uniref:Polysaccharide export protein n=1 Tax=Methylobacterium nodulans (strain LMG 21967 / CNCM I-2342 / ORS 2060) TaxID=460265 RepID=B8IGI4_METNO|nr:polysaccharide biosynthesis/export family protein [Methylobacterium nodulans]ACL55884.1 polysaccharide export protein [Methylobacterium nodulans ORS 2060]
MLHRFAFAPLLLLGWLPAHAAEYRLGPQDKVRLIVFEWRASRAETYSWAALNTEFTIGASGQLSLPLVGNIDAEGMTPEQLGNAVSEQLQKRLGLVERPVAAAEVSRYRPFYITGDVANPGEFPFRPGLTVLQAVAIAGGAYRPLGATAAGLERDATLARGDLRVMRAEQVSLTAKQARLKAEADDQARIDFPKDLLNPIAAPEAGDAVREEQLIFESRRNSVSSKIENLTQGKVLLDKEVAALNAKDAGLERQLTLALSERDNVRALASKGLAIGTRQLTTEQTVAQMETARLDIGIARVRAEQERARLERNILELRDQRRAEILIELRQVEAKLNELRERIVTADRLAFNAEVSGPEAEEATRESTANLQFKIVRAEAAGAATRDASDSTPLEPGDIVQVRRRRAPLTRASQPMASQNLAPRSGSARAIADAATQ